MRYEPEPEAPPLAGWGIQADSGKLDKPDRVELYVVEAAAREGLAIMTERLAAAEERVAAARERQLAALERIAALEAAHPIEIGDADRPELPARRPAARATTVRVTKSIAAGG